MPNVNGSAALSMTSIVKSFGGVTVLKAVDLTVNAGEAIGLLGENGAGKSTLIKILCGVHPADSGSITIDGRSVHISDTSAAKALGIQAVYQELSLFPQLSIFENIFIGSELSVRPHLLSPLKTAAMIEQSRAILADRLGLNIDVTKRVQELTLAERQLVEIARAMRAEAKIFVLDEPTTTLELREKDQLFKVIGDLKALGTAIIFISHHLEEVKQICERTVVLRDGAVVMDQETAELTPRAMVTAMSGTAPEQQYPKVQAIIGDTVLRVRDLALGKAYSNVSFDLGKGEIVGIAGLAGCGKGEVVRTIFGAARADSGEIEIMGRPVRLRSTHDAIRHRISYLPPDRKQESIFPDHDVAWNMSIMSLKLFSGLLGIKRSAELTAIADRVKSFGIKLASATQAITSLSGGNQQKVLVARCLLSDPSILLLEEPTRGVDVTAKRDIYQLITDYAVRGGSVVLVSSEETEVLGMSDRILVMREGLVRAELSRDEATLEQIRLISMSNEE
jgi:ribose transport system ATP-binding protein